MTDIPDTTDSRSMRERRDAGDPYRVDEELGAAMERAQATMRRANACEDADERRRLLEELLGSYAETAHLRAPVYVDYGDNLHVGEGTFANYGLMALDVAEIRIGAQVQMGPNVQLLTPTHPVEPGPRREGWEGARPITIEDNVWIGGGAIVLAGVTVGRDSIVGAGAVVTKDVPRGVVVVGNPARVVREL
ncbi:sugar O-acetyltransferase [Arsenicicoccus sp. UBA7492]|uniref:sugar O-acetyltransferase n=1 Tax=Arsenicicoccus sp. UBA7492 TaxID=1946057 RepID=UPI002579E7D7|nr:sugar O-acetyltransferase [Arsenicicoccus sp. UBA7492]